MSSSRPMREGMPLKYQMWETGVGQLDVAHALAAHLGAGDLDAAAVADLALVADLLVLAAVALPVLGGPEDALAEQAVALGLEGAVVDGLGLFDLAVGPLTDLFRGSDADLDGVKRCVTHNCTLLLLSISSIVSVVGQVSSSLDLVVGNRRRRASSSLRASASSVERVVCDCASVVVGVHAGAG